MKLKHLFTLPLVALLASCDKGGATPYKVAQSMPDDVDIVASKTAEGEPSDEYAEYLDDLVDGILNVDFAQASYRLHVDGSYSMSEDEMSTKESFKGDIVLAYAEGENETHNMYLALEDFSFSYKMTINYSQGKETYSFSGKGLDLQLFVVESGTNCDLYADLSDKELQDCVFNVLKQNEMIETREQFDGMLEYLLGEGNPGYLHIDATSVLTRVDGELEEAWNEEQAQLPEEERTPYQSMIAPFVTSPVTMLLGMGRNYFDEFVAGDEFKEYMGMVEMYLPLVQPALGVKYEDVSETEQVLSKVSICYNGSLKDVMKAAGAPAEALDNVPNVRFGLTVSVGDENGSEGYALQELGVGVDFGISDRYQTMSIKANASLECHYGEQAVIPFPQTFEAYASNPMIEALLVEKLVDMME